MPRVAVCLSGQPRNYRDTFPFIYKHIIEPNSADVFFHTWFDESNLYMEKTHIGRGACDLPKETIEELLFLYRPVAYLVEKPKSFLKPNLNVPDARIEKYIRLNGQTREEGKAHAIKTYLSMLYSIFKANELKEIHATSNGIVYDYVVRIRFDCLPLQPIILEQYNASILHYQDLGHPEGLISDWFNFGSNLIMNVYSSLFLHVEYYNSPSFYPLKDRMPNTLEPSNECGGYCEHMVRDMMTRHSIPSRAINFSLILHPQC